MEQHCRGGQATARGSEGLLPGCCIHQWTQQCLQAGPETQTPWCSAGVAALWVALCLAPYCAEQVPDDCPGERSCPGPQLQGWYRVSEKVQVIQGLVPGSAVCLGGHAHVWCSRRCLHFIYLELMSKHCERAAPGCATVL